MKKNFSYILAATVAGTFLTGCLKDDDNYIDYTEAPPAVQFLYAKHDGTRVIEAFDLAAEPQTMNLNVSLASNGPLSGAASAKVNLIANAAEQYNTAHGTEYEQLPANTYSIPQNTVSIPAGQTSVNFQVKIQSDKIDLAKKWMIGFQLADGSGAVVPANFGKIFIEVVIKNDWHGTYRAEGTFVHPSAGPRAISEDKELITTGPRSVMAPLGDLGGSNYYMIMTINADNTVTITPAGVTPNVDQSWGPNFYDPVKKEFHLNYSYNVAAPRIVDEVLTFSSR